MNAQTTDAVSTLDREREALLETLAEQRDFLLQTLQGLDQKQATTCITDSALTLAGQVKHLTAVERSWMSFIEEGEDLDADQASPRPSNTTRTPSASSVRRPWKGCWPTTRAARQTEEYVRSLPDLERTHQLAPAPWVEGEKFWSARKVLMHLIRETAQHCGHADIIRESLDGQKTMG